MADRLSILKERFSHKEICEPLLNRFLRYVKVYTTSDSSLGETKKPSTDRQFDLAKILVEELHHLGIEDVTLDEHCYVIAKIPATKGYENVPSIAFISHMDTVEDAPGKDVKPQIHKDYDGSVIEVGNGVVIDPKVTTNLKDCIGDTIITSDGTTLLGADDKAGIADIMTAIDFMLNIKPYPHGPIEVIFNSDEEIGNGTGNFPMDRVNSRIAYTVDGDLEGNYSIETFNASAAEIELTGFCCHPGSAKGVMVNASLMAAAFLSMIPENELPETTAERDGFYCVRSVQSSIDKAKISMILRDFDEEIMERRKEKISEIAKAVENKYPGGKVEVKFTYQYSNMYKYIKENKKVSDFLVEAIKKAGVVPVVEAIRGGTDGSELSRKGILTPNIFTGGCNFHSLNEFACLGHMYASVCTITELIKLWAEDK